MSDKELIKHYLTIIKAYETIVETQREQIKALQKQHLPIHKGAWGGKLPNAGGVGGRIDCGANVGLVES